MVAGLCLRYTAGTLHTVTSDAHCGRILKLFKNQLIVRCFNDFFCSWSKMHCPMFAQFRPMPNLCLSNFCPMSNQYPSYVHLCPPMCRQFMPNNQSIFTQCLPKGFYTNITIMVRAPTSNFWQARPLPPQLPLLSILQNPWCWWSCLSWWP